MIGLGAMRVVDGAVLDAAIAAGVDLIDTADAYGAAIGENERLVAAAVARAARAVKIVTKGGLTRPGGAWVPDGRARSLAAAARASLSRLGSVDLYLLHAIDPRVPLATSVRALARLRGDGVVRAIGLSNVGVAQLEAALALAPIEAVEIELGPWQVDAIRGGLVAACARRGIAVLAHRPLGGAAGARRLAREPIVGEIAARIGAAPAEIALAWVRAKGAVPLPGATRVETAVSAARIASLALDRDAIAALDARFLEVGGGARVAVAAPGAAEVVLIAGMPAAGKSTLAASYAARGYVRLNRDERGGTLLELARVLDDALAGGATRVVLDNTYVDRAARAPVVEVARRHGARVRCVIVEVSIEDAQVHAVVRMLASAGRLLEPDELARASMPGPGAQFRWRRDHEPPSPDEGFDAIERVAPPRAIPAGAHAAAIVDVRALDRARIDRWRDEGMVVVGTAWLPGGDAGALAARTRDQLGVEIAICAHAAGPPVCWCRKPLPGLGLALARAHDLDLARSIVVGRGAAERGFAARLGARFVEIDQGGGASTDV